MIDIYVFSFYYHL